MTNKEKKIGDGDYVLTDNAGWFAIKGFAVRLYATDEGIVVDVYKNGKEDQEPVTSTYAFDDEVCDRYLIRSVSTADDETLYWSNDFDGHGTAGWVDLASATVFTSDELIDHDLPIGGVVIMEAQAQHE